MSSKLQLQLSLGTFSITYRRSSERCVRSGVVRIAPLRRTDKAEAYSGILARYARTDFGALGCVMRDNDKSLHPNLCDGIGWDLALVSEARKLGPV